MELIPGAHFPEFIPKCGFTGKGAFIIDVVGIPTVTKNGATKISKIKGRPGGFPTYGNYPIYVFTQDERSEYRWGPQTGSTITPSAKQGAPGIPNFKLPHIWNLIGE